MAILATLTHASVPATPQQHRQLICGLFRAAVQAVEGWGKKLLAALLAVHSLSSMDRLKAILAMEDAPEQV